MTCIADCADEIREAVCDCVVKNGLCGENCTAVNDLGPECSTYGIHVGFCGGLIDAGAIYRDICDGCSAGTIII